MAKEKITWNDHINWDVVDAMTEKYGLGAKITMFDDKTFVNPTHSVFADETVDIQPKWNIPEKIIVATAITGAFYNKVGNPNHPVGMDEIYKSAVEVCEAGAPILHLHVRNEAGYNTLDYKLFKELTSRIKDKFPEVMIDCCLVPMNDNQWDDFLRLVDEGLVDSTPVNTTTCYCGDAVFTKYPHAMLAKSKVLRENNIRTRIAVYNTADIDNADRYLFRTGLIQTGATGKRSYWGVLPALPGCLPMNSPDAMVDGFLNMRRRILEIDKDAIIQVCASGRASTYLATQAILLGCHLRVGMEDTVWRWPHKDVKLSNNAEVFRSYKQLCELLGREIVTPKEYREMMGIPEKR